MENSGATKQIVIADRGFVYVGEVERSEEFITIRNGQNVRRWGTTKGLGELAQNGPTAKTVLDPVPTVHIPMRAVIALIEVEPAKWDR